MPASPWKKGRIADGLLSGLRSKHGGSLVVQTGFPTSLADLVVKNHGLLKKSSQRNKKKLSVSSDLAVASPSGDGDSRLAAPGSCSTALEVGNSIQTDRSTSPVMMIVGFWPGFWFLVGQMILLTVLAIGKKKLVLGITISAFMLLLLEIYGVLAWRFLNPCADARKRLDSVVGSLTLGGRERASPIREIGAEIPDESIQFVRSSEESSMVSDLSSNSSVKSKPNKLLKRFMPKRFHGERQGGKVPHLVDVLKEELPEKYLGKEKEEWGVDDESQSFKFCNGDLDDIGEDSYGSFMKVDRNRFVKFPQFVFFLLVLCGLVKGKAVSLLLALSWSLLYRFIEEVWRRWKKN